MSMAKYDDPKIPGLMGPFYPPLVLDMVRAEGARSDSLSGSALDRVASTVPGYARRYRNMKDHIADPSCYVWFWVLVFRVHGGEVHVAFPWAQDWDAVDGTQLDRSPAVYTKGKVDLDAANSVVARLTRAMQTVT